MAYLSVTCFPSGTSKARANEEGNESRFLTQDPEGFQKTFCSKEKGYGLIATRNFKKGDFLLFYRGKRITKEEADEHLAVRNDFSL